MDTIKPIIYFIKRYFTNFTIIYECKVYQIIDVLSVKKDKTIDWSIESMNKNDIRTALDFLYQLFTTNRYQN